MKITFYEINTPTNQLVKPLENGVEVEGALRDSASILTPSFNIEAKITPVYNYCFIPSFNRYYFITDITRVNNNIVRIECKVDVLMSFANDIKNSLAKAKQAINANNYYNKAEIGVEVRTTETKIDFPNKPFNENGTIILVAINGTGVV